MMALVHIFLCLTLVNSAVCLECYSCLFSSFPDPNSVLACDDPMVIGEVPAVRCLAETDQCFASRLMYETQGIAGWKVNRFCGNATICEKGNYPGDLPGAEYKHYCCSDDKCNHPNAYTGATPTPITSTTNSAGHKTPNFMTLLVFVTLTICSIHIGKEVE